MHNKTCTQKRLCMGSRTGSVMSRALIFVLLLTLAVALGLGAGYLHKTYKPTVTVSLNGAISFDGVDTDMLRLQKDEIRQLNRSFVKHRNTFTGMSIVVDGKGIMAEIQPKTTLVWTMTLSTYADSTVKSWPRKCRRKHLVDRITENMDVAAKEYKSLNSIPDVRKSIRQIYI
ncbi:hypothetical protein JCM12178A_28380 [Salidesulfovibrio brasiliensis]